MCDQAVRRILIADDYPDALEDRDLLAAVLRGRVRGGVEEQARDGRAGLAGIRGQSRERQRRSATKR